MLTRKERIEGGLVGLLVGDALGVPYEFEVIPSPEQIEFVPPPDHWHAWPGTPPGTWSDDSAQALCLLASLLECGRLDAEDLAGRLLAPRRSGMPLADGKASLALRCGGRYEEEDAPVAQLDRAAAFGAAGCRFKSCRACSPRALYETVSSGPAGASPAARTRHRSPPLQVFNSRLTPRKS